MGHVIIMVPVLCYVHAIFYFKEKGWCSQMQETHKVRLECLRVAEFDEKG